jgi:hypothetical protein
MTMPSASFEQDVFPAELQEIAARRSAAALGAPPLDGGPDASKGLVGLSLSGGGIRSATFALGAVQGLAREDALDRIDYLSTVSGGGFTGGAVSSVLNDPAAGTGPSTFPLRDVTGREEPPAVRHVRNSANYLAPGGLLDRVRIPAIFVRGVLMNALGLVPYLVLAAVVTQWYFSAEADAWAGPIAGVLAVLGFLALLLLTKFATTRFSWKWRNRYESWLASSFLLLLVLVGAFFLPSLVSGARDVRMTELGWRLAMLARDPSTLWRAGIVAALLAALATAAQFSPTAARIRATLVLYALGLLGPLVLIGGYLLACVLYLEPRWLGTTALETPMPDSAQLLDYGYVPAVIAGEAPSAMESCGPREMADWHDERGAVVAACGSTYVAGPAAATPRLQWFLAHHLAPDASALAALVADLDAGRVPATIGDEWFFDEGEAFRLDESSTVEPRGAGAWAVTQGGHTLFVRREPDAMVTIWWERPYSAPDPLNPWPFGRLAHVHPRGEGAWTLTSSGRAFDVRREHDLLTVSWDLSVDLERGLVSDAVRHAFADKGGLPADLVVEQSEVAGSRWLLYPTGPAPSTSAGRLPSGGYRVIIDDPERAAAEPLPIEVRREGDRYSTSKRPPFMGRDLDYAFLLAALAWLVLYNGLFLNVNASAFHGFYRDRLSRAYLFRQPRGEDHPLEANDRQRLSGLNAPGTRAPYHLINVALNLNGMAEPDMRGRQSDFFVFSKRYTGCPRTGYCRTADMEQAHRHLDLASALAISGAAAAPNAGTATLRPLVFLLTLLNVRLGYWLPHPARVSAPWYRWSRLRLLSGVGSRYLWLEALGGVSSRAPYVNLSDGGHIENLGAYQLLRRRAKVIVCLDGGQDGAGRCEDLLQLMMFARIDLGTDIEIDVSALRPAAGTGRSSSHVAFGRIDYGGGQYGWLVYVKSSLTGDEGPLVTAYRESHPDFPHQSTANQFFDERQFEVYRELGFHVVSSLFAELRTGSEGRLDERARHEILEALTGPAAGAATVMAFA